MKKIFFSLIAVIAGAMSSYAQSALVATLSHGSNITPYYGESAFVEAYTAAADGDCITLSAGAFTAVESIEKAITIRGVGMKSNGTTFTGECSINIEEKRAYPLIFEGIQMTISEITGDITQTIQFIKAYLLGWYYYDRCVVLRSCSTSFVNCIIDRIRIESESVNTYIYNCLINFLDNSNGCFNVQNCVLKLTYYGFYKGNFTNCIFIGAGGDQDHDPIVSTNTAEYCVGYNSSHVNYFSNISSTTNNMVDNLSDLFKSYNEGDFLNESNFELTDAVKAAYRGSDGTEVGIFGGANPYSTATTNPRIINFSITTNTEDSQLKVKLNVE